MEGQRERLRHRGNKETKRERDRDKGEGEAMERVGGVKWVKEINCMVMDDN